MIPLTSRRTGVPAAHAILAVCCAFVVLAVASWQGVLQRGTDGAGDASSFDFGVADTVAPSSESPGSLDAIDDESTLEPTPTVVSEAPTPTVAPATVAPAEPVDSSRKPTKDDPLRLYIAGDSDAGTMGPPLQRELEKTGLVDSNLYYKPSSGLSVPEFFNWPEKLKNDVEAFDPDVVVVTFGGNDAQDIEIDGDPAQVDSPEWKAEYGRRVGAVMDYLSGDGRTLIWVGIPNAKSEDFRVRLQILEQVTRDEVAKRPGVVYVDVWNMFVGLSGGYADFIIDKRDGQGKQVRQDDGFHLNTTGAEILALNVAEEVRKDMRDRGAQV